jgi:hypothetical protein
MHEPGPGFSGILPQIVRIAADQVLPGASVAEFVGQQPGEDGIIRPWTGSNPIDGT